MKSDRIRRRRNIAICVSAALLAIAPASTVRAADGDDFARMGAMSDATAQPLQMGVGQSVIRDLPEEAGEIYVGDPNVANAIVRTAKRIYISGVANGHTSIFALAKDGRRIAFFQVSVGRAIGELTALLNVAVPGNEIRVRTVENTIILTGSVASAEEAQKALDIASGFVNDSPTSSSGNRPSDLHFERPQWRRSRRRQIAQQPSGKSGQRSHDSRRGPSEPARHGRRNSA